MTEFVNKHLSVPVRVTGYKQFAPFCESGGPEPFYKITLVPFNRFDKSDKKRMDIDKAIIQLTEIVKRFVVCPKS